ncbi:MAG: hypothetical protein ACREFQ_05420 [Stellaceae bacterium]
MTETTVRRLRRFAGSARRLPVTWPAELRFLRLRRACVVFDISCTGASIGACDVPGSVAEATLVLAAGPPIAATIAWRAGDRIGLSFRLEQDWIGAMSARRFDPAAWLD